MDDYNGRNAPGHFGRQIKIRRNDQARPALEKHVFDHKTVTVIKPAGDGSAQRRSLREWLQRAPQGGKPAVAEFFPIRNRRDLLPILSLGNRGLQDARTQVLVPHPVRRDALALGIRPHVTGHGGKLDGKRIIRLGNRDGSLGRSAEVPGDDLWRRHVGASRREPECEAVVQGGPVPAQLGSIGPGSANSLGVDESDRADVGEGDGRFCAPAIRTQHRLGQHGAALLGRLHRRQTVRVAG